MAQQTHARDEQTADFRNIYRHGFARVAACTVPVALADPATNAVRIGEQVRRQALADAPAVEAHTRRPADDPERLVDLDLAPGEILGLVGESGSGKSVTLRSLLRLVHPPGRIAGEVLWHGRDLLALREAELTWLRAFVDDIDSGRLPWLDSILTERQDHR